MKTIVLASHNAGKLKELQAMLGDSFQVRSIAEFSSEVPEETGLSFIENAILKARHAARVSGLPALADDSGLAVDYLGAHPVSIRLATRVTATMPPTTANCCRRCRMCRMPSAARSLSAHWRWYSMPTTRCPWCAKVCGAVAFCMRRRVPTDSAMTLCSG